MLVCLKWIITALKIFCTSVIQRYSQPYNIVFCPLSKTFLYFSCLPHFQAVVKQMRVFQSYLVSEIERCGSGLFRCDTVDAGLYFHSDTYISIYTLCITIVSTLETACWGFLIWQQFSSLHTPQYLTLITAPPGGSVKDCSRLLGRLIRGGNMADHVSCLDKVK